MPTIYGQVVVGPPGSGKTTFCDGMQQYLRLLGRDAWVVNLDPANEGGGHEDIGETEASESTKQGFVHRLPYETLFDVCEEAVNLSSVMLETGLGPNGGLVYSMEYILKNINEIIQRIQERITTGRTYLIFDFPGQVELYTHSTCVQTLLQQLSKKLDLRLTAVQLVDAQYCTDAAKFLSASLLATTTMLRLELPMVSVLSKIDLLTKYGELPMQLEFFTECHDLERLLPYLDDPITSIDDLNEDELAIIDDPEYQRARQKRRQSKHAKKFAKLHSVMAEVIQDFSLLSFIPLNITSAESVGRVLARIDKCNGYAFTEGSVNEDLFQCAIQRDMTYETLAEVQERIAAPETIKELHR